ncbi:hypothetical protein SAMN04488134_11316 [Amphibacillus marinus]|uniref:Uncharacterized protein n=1 Tax=Amphibacillus marinus TaxID=872970 RepID=A0A1H8SKL5_9BACI|nr:SGNH/GDSL hydrolase family protein [Amphibacillus marinus]SEO79115.1 hypothetical protein SAMN04488134_11316 [Amphibacillus marinus]
MKAKSLFVALLSTIIFGVFIVIGFFYYQGKLADINDQAQVTYANYTNERKERQQRLVEMDLYGKINEGETVNYLVLGDHIGYQDVNSGERWSDLVEQSLREAFDVRMQGDYISFDTNDVLGRIVELNDLVEDASYDLVFLVLSDADRDIINSFHQYELQLETLLDKIISHNDKAEIVTIFEGDIEQEGMSEVEDVVIKMADHYGFKFLSATDKQEHAEEDYLTFEQAEVKLTEDGHMYYAEQISSYLIEQAEGEKEIQYVNHDPLFAGSNYDQVVYSNEPTRITGFEKEEGFFIAQSAGDSLIFQFEGELLAVHFFNQGGLIEVYLDGEFLQQLHLSSINRGNRYLTLLNDLPAKQYTVQFIVREMDGPIKIGGLVTK